MALQWSQLRTRVIPGSFHPWHILIQIFISQGWWNFFQPPFTHLLNLLSCIAKNGKSLKERSANCQASFSGPPLSVGSWLLESWLPWKRRTVCVASLLCATARSSAGLSAPLPVTSPDPSTSHPTPNVPRGKGMTGCRDLSKSFLFYFSLALWIAAALGGL